jgi:hypothetical protein
VNFSSRKWNKFLLGEAQQENVDKFLDTLSRVKPSEAPFNNIFNGKWRMVIDYAPKEYGYLREIAARMEELGHEIEHVPGKVTGPGSRSEYDYHMGRNREAEERTPASWMVIKKKDKSSWHQRNNMLYTAWIKAIDDGEAETGVDAQDAQGLLAVSQWVDKNPDNPYAKAFKETFAQYKKHQKRGIRRTKLGKVIAREFKDRPEVIESWNNNAGEYNKKENIFKVAKATEKYSTVISRHPVDIYRMSDHMGITSCHSLGSSHPHCAIAEAEDFGMIAYVVETEDLKGLDLDDDEVFYDADRHGSGTGLIEPVARKRLRRYFNKEENYDLALPDKTEYGLDRMPGFMGFLTDWAAEAQRELVFGKDEERNRPEITDFIRMGGSYEDTPDKELFDNMFKPKEEYKYRAAYKDDEGNIVEPSPWYGRTAEEWQAASTKILEDIKRRIPPQHQWGPWAARTSEAIPAGSFLSVVESVDSEKVERGAPDPMNFSANLKMIFHGPDATEKGKEMFKDNLYRTAMGYRTLDDEVADIFKENMTEAEGRFTNIQYPMSLDWSRSVVIVRVDLATDGFKSDPEGFKEFGEVLLKDLPNMIKTRDDVVKAFTAFGIFGDEPEALEKPKKKLTLAALNAKYQAKYRAMQAKGEQPSLRDLAQQQADETGRHPGEGEKPKGIAIGQAAIAYAARQQRLADVEREYREMLARGSEEAADEFLADARENDWYTGDNRPDPDADIFEHKGPYQKKVKAKHKRMKIRLIGKGKGKHTAGPYKNKPSYKRTKSAPPGG